MSYQAQDGKVFPNVNRGRKYDRSLQAEKAKQDIAKAPGGPQHENDVRLHGPALKLVQEFVGNGRWKVSSIHPDGYRHQSVHPESFRALDVGKVLLGQDMPPPAIQTHARARAIGSVGPKEEKRIDAEDGRVVGRSRWQDFEDEEESER